MSTLDKIIEAQHEILDSLAGWETRAATLYEKYGLAFPKSRDLWNTLAGEERTHAAMLIALKKQLAYGDLFQNIGRFRKDAIASQTALVTKALQQLGDERIKESEAISTAVGIETSLFESRFYEIVESDSPEFKRVAKALSEATRIHAQRLNDKLVEYSPQGEPGSYLEGKKSGLWKQEHTE